MDLQKFRLFSLLAGAGAWGGNPEVVKKKTEVKVWTRRQWLRRKHKRKIAHKSRSINLRRR
jgi:hypothetical protein